MFFLHHGQLDRLWWMWQVADPENRVRKLPGLVQEGLVLGDLVEIEEWNEYGELKQHVKIHYDEHTIPNIHHKHPEPDRADRGEKSKKGGQAQAEKSERQQAALVRLQIAHGGRPREWDT